MTSNLRIEKHERPVEVVFNGFTLAHSTRALRLDEDGYPARYYIPKDDVDVGMLERTSKQTHCPYKGTASYYSVRIGGHQVPNGAWVYEQPIKQAEGIEDHLCFDDSTGIEVHADAEQHPVATADLAQFPNAKQRKAAGQA